MPPIDSAGLTHRVATTLELLREPRVCVEAGWPREQLLVQCDELFCPHGRLDLRGRARSFGSVVMIVFVRLLRFVVGLLEQADDVTLGCLHIFGRDDAFADQAVTPHLPRRWVRLDR